MKKLIQTRLHNPPEQEGNCFATVIACLMDLDSPEDVLQFQEFYDWKKTGRSWVDELTEWLLKRNYKWFSIKGHHQAKKDEFYLVTGNTSRSKDVLHVCIYQNGKLVHDPHPDQSGLTTEKYFEIIRKT